MRFWCVCVWGGGYFSQCLTSIILCACVFIYFLFCLKKKKIVFRAMRSTCHSNANIVHDCSSTRGHGIDIQNYIQAIDATVVHTANPHFHEGDFSIVLLFLHPSTVQTSFIWRLIHLHSIDHVTSNSAQKLS